MRSGWSIRVVEQVLVYRVDAIDLHGKFYADCVLPLWVLHASKVPELELDGVENHVRNTIQNVFERRRRTKVE